MIPNHIQSVDFVNELIQKGFDCITHVPGRGICATGRMAYTVGLFYGFDNYRVNQGRYCFHTKAEAVAALKDWDGIDDPPGAWIKHFGKNIEYINPNSCSIENWELLNLTPLERSLVFNYNTDIYSKLNITFYIREATEDFIRIRTEQGPCASSVNYCIPELVRITKQIFDPVRNGRKLLIAPKPYEPNINTQSSKTR